MRAEHHHTRGDQTRVVLHAAGLALIGALNAGVGDIIGRIMGWLNVHLDESPWVARGTEYNQRAYRVVRPWWEAADTFATIRYPDSPREQE